MTKTEGNDLVMREAMAVRPATGGRLVRTGGLLCASMLLLLLLGVSHAAAFGVDIFDGGAFDADGQPTTQAGAHPFEVRAVMEFPLTGPPQLVGGPIIDQSAKDLHVDLPVGFAGNPTTVAECTQSDLVGNGASAACPNDSQVGTIQLRSGTQLDPYALSIYNMAPAPGNAATFGFNAVGTIVYLNARVRPEDHGITVHAEDINQSIAMSGATVTFWGVPQDARHDDQRCHVPIPDTGKCDPASADDGTRPHAANLPARAFLTNPTQCTGEPVVTRLRADSWGHPDEVVEASFISHDDASPPNPVVIAGCDRTPFVPELSVSTSGSLPDAPTGLSVELGFDQDGTVNSQGIASAHLKDASVVLPEGMTINPASAAGLVACADAQARIGSGDAVSCPDGSKIGEVTAVSPLLDQELSGGVYLRPQASDDPASGDLFRIVLNLVSEERGIDIKLPARIFADPATGRLTARFVDNPQLPVSSVRVALKSGPRAPLVNPSSCGPKVVSAHLTSWAGQEQDLVSTVQVACTPGLGWFGPYFSAGTVNPVAGASSPFVLRVNKPDGQSDLNGLAMVLPEGLLASLKGNVGTRVGTARVAAGPGSNPFWLSGPVVLEGPYGDAPFSLRVTVPAVAGPFNLGDVVVRQRIYVDPHDAHVTVVSDPLPTIVKGVPVRLQSLAVDVDKAGFMQNPTSCASKTIGGTLAAATGQSVSVASRFQVGDCGSLPLAPKMRMELIGKKETRRGQHPTLSTTLTQRPGESGLKKVRVRLPLSLALDPDNAQALCKPEQAVAKACPKESIVGHATAVTPLLNRPLTGDVFFVEGTRKTKEGRTASTLPKLWVALRGEVALDVWADSATQDGKYLVTTFGFVPDAPISSFKLDINGGKHGILAVTGQSGASLCKQSNVTKATFDGQNGKQVTTSVRMSSPCGFQVTEKSLTNTHAKVTVAGIGAGKLSISGRGIHRASRSIRSAGVATIKPRLTSAGMRLAKQGKALRLRVSFNPKAKGKKTRTTRTTVKQAKKSSTR